MENNSKSEIKIVAHFDWCQRDRSVNEILKIINDVQKECPNVLVHIEANYH